MNTYMILFGKSGRKGRLGHKWYDNIKMDGVIGTGLMWLRMGISGGLMRTR
jgi:hypothetical protein